MVQLRFANPPSSSIHASWRVAWRGLRESFLKTAMVSLSDYGAVIAGGSFRKFESKLE
jgi:hypothetical protein